MNNETVVARAITETTRRQDRSRRMTANEAVQEPKTWDGGGVIRELAAVGVGMSVSWVRVGRGKSRGGRIKITK